MDANRPLLPAVLLVDPIADTRRMYVHALKFAGFEIEEAVDGRDALAKALSSHHDVILTETRLPGIDGYELCRLLRRDPETRSVPILVVTADTYPPDLARAQRAGATIVLMKPCLPDALLVAIRQAMDAVDPDLSTHAAADAPAMPTPEAVRRLSKSRAFQRGETIAPPRLPPHLVCPACDRILVYERSYVGGVSARHSEQWDLFVCQAGCGTFQYRQRTRLLRRV